MKFKNSLPPGEFAAKALFKNYINGEFDGWSLSSCFYFSKEEARKIIGYDDLLWPVQIQDDGLIYIPHESELEGLE